MSGHLTNNHRKPNKVNNFQSTAILDELEEFINSKHDLLKLQDSKRVTLLEFLSPIFNSQKWYFVFFNFILILVFFVPILWVLGFPENLLILFLQFIRNCLFIFLICFIVNMFLIAKKGIEWIRKDAINKIRKYDLSYYYNLIDRLGNNFEYKYLNQEEIRFEAIIRQRKNQKTLFKSNNPYLAIFLVVIAISILGFPNLDRDNTIALLYGAIVGVSGIVAIVKNVLDTCTEHLYKDIDIYEQCVLILQKAQIIAAEKEAEEEAEDIYAYDRAIADNDEAIPFEQATLEIDNNV